MKSPEFVMVSGCNAAGKSTFIRTRLAALEEFSVFMTDVYKSRTKELVKQSITQKKRIIVETVFNDTSFKDLVDLANNSGYQTSLIVLFLDSIQQSINRVSLRSVQQNGIAISDGNVKLNFNESFKNISTYFFYFDRTDFIYTGVGGENRLIMSFHKGELITYNSNNLDYPQKFATYSYHTQRMDEDAYQIITSNNNFRNGGIGGSTQPIKL